MRSLVLPIAAALSFVLAPAGVVRAQGRGAGHGQGGHRATAEVFIVLAKEAPGEVEPELADMPGLRRPPFNSFRSLAVLSKPRVTLVEGHDVDVALPNGRTLRIRLVQATADHRFQLKVSINRPNESDYLPLLQVVASPGDPFFVGGQVYQDGTLILGVRVRE